MATGAGDKKSRRRPVAATIRAETAKVRHRATLCHKLAESLLAIGQTQSCSAFPRPNVEKLATVHAAMVGATDSEKAVV